MKAFRANQGLLLAGAVAYYALLSIVPLLILTVIELSQIIDENELLQTLGRYLEWLNSSARGRPGPTHCRNASGLIRAEGLGDFSPDAPSPDRSI